MGKSNKIRKLNKKSRISRRNKSKTNRKAGAISMDASFLDILIYRLKECLKLNKKSDLEMEFESIKNSVDRLNMSYIKLYSDLQRIIENKENNINATDDIKEKKEEIKRVIAEIKILKRELLSENDIQSKKKTRTKTRTRTRSKKISDVAPSRRPNLMHIR
jgi:hypothetical protein